MADSILKDDDGDLLTINGDLVIGDADGQVITDNLLLSEGQLRYAPLAGIAVQNAMLAKGTPTSMMHRIQQKLKADKATNISVKWNGTQIVTAAEYV